MRRKRQWKKGSSDIARYQIFEMALDFLSNEIDFDGEKK